MSSLWALFGGSWPLLGRPWGSQRAPLGPPWGSFVGASGSFWVIFESLNDPRAHQGPNWEPFWRDLALIFIDFRNISMRESACKLAFAMVCITHSALLPAQFQTGLVAVCWIHRPYGTRHKLPQTTTTTTTTTATTTTTTTTTATTITRVWHLTTTTAK